MAPGVKRARIDNNCHHGPTNVYHITSPIGPLRLEACAKGVHNLHQDGDQTLDENFVPNAKAEVKLVRQQYPDNGYQHQPVANVLQWLVDYFAGNTENLKPPNICNVYAVKDSFRYRVWHSLLENVSFGHTTSYSDLAIACGSTASARRAVGQAMRQNPVQVIIPCHRVIRGDGKMGHYSRGRRDLTKQWLLRHEGVTLE